MVSSTRAVSDTNFHIQAGFLRHPGLDRDMSGLESLVEVIRPSRSTACGWINTGRSVFGFQDHFKSEHGDNEQKRCTLAMPACQNQL